MRFVDLFAGMGGFHRALASLGHECVAASEIDEELAELYRANFRSVSQHVLGDIRIDKGKIPPHDILCAGFPCQPFSKSGSQNGRRDRTRGTLFHQIIEVLARHTPKYLILENVGNFERHNRGRTWQIVRESLSELGYHVAGTTHVTTKGHGLISPHHLGYPHTRERFFIVGSLSPLPPEPFPPRDKTQATTLTDIVQRRSELSSIVRDATALTGQQTRCIEHWNRLLARLPKARPIPSFPIWGDEIGATYPYVEGTPFGLSAISLRHHVHTNGGGKPKTKAEMMALLPSYARVEEDHFPEWKIAFIRQNREWLSELNGSLTPTWVSKLREFPASLRKLEWNCKGEERDLWKHVLQFRPSGLRAKRYSSSPALVAMTTTQIPILGPERRFLTETEGLRLQGFPDHHKLPITRSRAFTALGNAVHVQVVKAIATRLLRSAR